MKKIPFYQCFFRVFLLFFVVSAGTVHVNAACPEKSFLIVVSNHFGPYITASNALEKRLNQKCPGAAVRKLFLDQPQALRDGMKTGGSPSMVFPVGTEAAIMVHENFPLLPSVFSMVLDPSAALSKGPDAVGVVLDIPYEQVWKRLRMLAPQVSRIGILYTDESEALIKKIAGELAGSDLMLIRLRIDSPEHIQERLEEIFRLSDALIAIPDMNIYNNILAPRIMFEAIRHGKPFVGLSKNFTMSGALFSLDCDYTDIGRQAADLGLEIMYGGIRGPKIQYPRKFSAYLNLHTARLIGLSPDREALKSFKILAY